MSALAPGPIHTLRVGVTGAIELDPDHLQRLREQTNALLGQIVVRGQAETDMSLRLQLVSPLAEGADRLVAGCAIDAGFELTCPMPFSQPAYEQDFKTPGSLAEFHALLERAGPRVLMLDGGRPCRPQNPSPAASLDEPEERRRKGQEARAYEAVGRLVVRNCDLIIAIWDGLPGRGVGGGADTIRYAASFGPPVIWLHATDPGASPCWIEEAHDLRPGIVPRTLPLGSPGGRPMPAESPLHLYLHRLLARPPAPPHRHDHTWMHRSIHCCLQAWRWIAARGDPPQPPPLDIFLHEQPRAVCRLLKLHGFMMRVMAPGLASPASAPVLPLDPDAARWFDHYRPADARASEYASRYRSSYVWAFALGAIALSAFAIALVCAACHIVMWIATAVEGIALLLILGLIVIDVACDWQRRAIEYRLLAELCRKQQALAPLAWVIPRASAWATALPDPPSEPNAPHPEPISWVGWLFTAWLRETRLPEGKIDPARVEAAKHAAIRDLLEDQILYHHTRRSQSYRAGRNLVEAGAALFVLVLAAVGVKLLLAVGLWPWIPVDRAMPWLELACGIFPALSAAFVGIRAYAELELLADQSHAMLTELRHARDQISALDSTAPLASQTLGSALATVATMMLQDLEGWARLFRAKVVEA